MVACAQSSGFCEYFRCVESDSKIATYETKRRGSEPVQRSFTIADAKTASLLGNPTWKKYPAAMLRARCKADLARDVYPDAVAGVYTDDEAAEFAPAATVHEIRDATPHPRSATDVIDADFTEHTGDEAKDYEALIGQATTVDELEAMLPELQRLPVGDYRAERSAQYAAKIRELRAA